MTNASSEISRLEGTVIALHAQLADAQAAQALVVERMATLPCAIIPYSPENKASLDAVTAYRDAIRSLAPIDGLALLQELRAERDRFEAALGRACLVGGTTYLVERAEKAEAERDRLAAENAVLEAKVAGLVEAAEDAEYDLLQWLECSKALTAAGFNMDGTADVTAKLTAALSHIKRGKTNG